jgi:hypothetical protein
MLQTNLRDKKVPSSGYGAAHEENKLVFLLI